MWTMLKESHWGEWFCVQLIKSIGECMKVGICRKKTTLLELEYKDYRTVINVFVNASHGDIFTAISRWSLEHQASF